MEYNWLMLAFSVLLLLNPGFLKTLDSSDELHCDVRELVTCGNNMGYYSWEFCRARTKNVKRIRSVHLDIRYQNRFCRSYGTPKNFGLTEPGDSMWVVRSCYGTFLLCLELDPTSTTDKTSSTSLLFMLDKYDSSGEKRHTITSTDTFIGDKPNMEVSHKNDHVENESMIDEALQDINNLENIVKEKQSLDLTTKVLLIAAITTAGLCLICLVSTIGCYTIIRRPHFNTNRHNENDIDPEDTTVTSIPGLDPCEEENIYNVIPCDEQNTCSNTEYKTLAPLDYEENIQTVGNLHVYASTREILRDNVNLPCVMVTPENDYDRLRNSPKVSVSDSKTYDRLSDFIKERQKYAKTEMLQQNDHKGEF